MRYLIFNTLDGSLVCTSLDKIEEFIDRYFERQHMPGTASVSRDMVRGLKIGDYCRPGPFVIVAVNPVQ